MNRLTGLSLVTAATFVSGCAITAHPEPAMPPQASVPSVRETAFTDALPRFDFLLSSRLDQPVVIELKPIPNKSGEDGLPQDISSMLATELSSLERSTFVLPALDPTQMSAEYYGQIIRNRAVPDYRIEGAISGGERWTLQEKELIADLFFDDRGDAEGDRFEQDDSVDSGATWGGSHEARQVVTDLQLVEESTGLIVKAISIGVIIAKNGKATSYGAFFRGSGIGYRARRTIAQTTEEALRVSLQQGIMILLGRHFEAPWWRSIPETEPDEVLLGVVRDRISSLDTDGLHGFLGQLLKAHKIESLQCNVDALQYLRHLPHPEGVASADGPGLLADLSLRAWFNLPAEEPQSHWITRTNDAIAARLCPLLPLGGIRYPLYFAPESATLSRTEARELEALAETLATTPAAFAWELIVEGFTDHLGDPRYNEALSERRGLVVAEYLKSKFPNVAITVHPRGPSRSRDDRAHNRRVDVNVVLTESLTSHHLSRANDQVASHAPRPVQGSQPGSAPAHGTLEDLLVRLSMPNVGRLTLSELQVAYPDGRIRNGDYWVDFDSSPYFRAVILRLPEGEDDPAPQSALFFCKPGAGKELRSLALEALPPSYRETKLGSNLAWTALPDGTASVRSNDGACLLTHWKEGRARGENTNTQVDDRGDNR